MERTLPSINVTDTLFNTTLTITTILVSTTVRSRSRSRARMRETLALFRLPADARVPLTFCRLTGNYHIKSPFSFFQIPTQSSWDQRSWCRVIVLFVFICFCFYLFIFAWPQVPQTGIHRSAPTGDNNLSSQPSSAPDVNIDPVCAPPHHWATCYHGHRSKPLRLWCLSAWAFRRTLESIH